ncbi:MAG TPA: hypothetical protein VNN15_07270, partial [Solirubrobacterales bacterium]|nr:hypothetical protein [Solirubrobacterales bacterium]
GVAAVAALARCRGAAGGNRLDLPFRVLDADAGDDAAEADRVMQAAEDASTSSFRLGLGIAGILMIVGGIVAGVGVQNPKRQVKSVPTRGAAAAGECGHGSDADCADQQQKARAAAETT